MSVCADADASVTSGPLSVTLPLILLTWGLSLNLELSWQPASPRDPPVSASSGFHHSSSLPYLTVSVDSGAYMLVWQARS